MNHAAKFNSRAAIAGLRVAEEHLREAARFLNAPLDELTACPLCGLHPHDFTVEEYEREVERLQRIIDDLRRAPASGRPDGEAAE